MQLNLEHWVTTTCVSEVVKVFLQQFRELWTERVTLVADTKRVLHLTFSRLSLERPQESTAGRLSPSLLSLPCVTHRCKGPGLSTDSYCHSFNQPPQMGPPVLPFGRRDFHSNGHLRKRHLGPAWCRIVTNSELLNHYITEEKDLYAPVADSVIQGVLKMLSLDFTHSVTCLCSWIVLLEQLN